MEVIDVGSADAGSAFFLFGIFCAYWARTTGRNGWLWSSLGLFFAPITGLVLLHENAQYRRHPSQ